MPPWLVALAPNDPSRRVLATHPPTQTFRSDARNAPAGQQLLADDAPVSEVSPSIIFEYRLSELRFRQQFLETGVHFIHLGH